MNFYQSVSTNKPASDHRFLDVYTGASAGYSLRKIRHGYTGYAVKVRRSNDDGLASIGFDVHGELDVAALASHCGSNDGYVDTWFDQSSNANHATQSTPADQPKIYDGTTGVITRGPKNTPSIYFSSGTQNLDLTTFVNNTSYLYVGEALGRVHHFGSTATGNSSMRADATNKYYRNYGFEWANQDIKINHNGADLSSTDTLVPVTFGFDIALFQTSVADTTDAEYISQENAQYISEIVTWNSNKYSDFPDISASVNTFYEAYGDFLDNFGGAEIAYSLRRLSSTYNGPAIEVRRDSDNTYQDIGFTENGNLDEYALTSFVGSGSAYIRTWYDQSSNARHAPASVESIQPRIVNSGTIEKINGKPAIYFDFNNLQRFGHVNFNATSKSHFSIFHVVQHYSLTAIADQAYYSWETSRTLSKGTNVALQDSANVSHSIDWSDPAVDTQYIKSATVNGSTGGYSAYINGTEDVSGTFSGYSGAFSTFTNNRHGIGYRNNGSFYLRGYMQEIMVYHTNQETDQRVMQESINNYYGVY